MFLFKDKIKKRGQFWYIDLLIALFVVIVIAILFVKGITDIVDREKDVNDLLSEGIDISNNIMSKGLLSSTWCSGNDGRIGFVQDSKIVNTNFNDFKTLVQTTGNSCSNPSSGSIDGYTKSRILLGIKSQYVIYMQNKDGDIIGNPGSKVFGYDIGVSNPTNIGDILNAIDQNIGPDNKVNIFRYAFYDTDPVDGKGELIRIGITVWKK